MANEYRIHLLGAEILHAGGGEARIFANAVTVIHGDQANLPNAHIFSLNVNALHGDQQSLPNAYVHGVALEVLTSTIQELSPNFVEAVDDSDVFPLRTFGFAVPPPFLIEDRERNPYPASFIAVDPDEQQRIIREQHNSTQAGDSTFDFGLLLRPTPDQLYTLGSLGKFYHDDYGMIHARYVRIDSWVEVDAQGCPVGRLAESPEVDWLVTNDFSKSSPDLAMGFTFFGTTPKAGEYGWMVVDGANPAMVLPSTAILPAPDTPYTWTGTGTIGIGTSGKIVGRRWGPALLATIPQGTLYVRTEGFSPASFAELVQQETLELAEALAALTVRVSASESNILGLSTQANSLAAGLNSLELALTAETNARVRDISSIRLLVGATDWNQTIADAVGVAREEFSAADELIKVSVAEARFIAEDALARASGSTGSFDEQISAITNQLAGLVGRLINFTVDYDTPTSNDVLITNVTLSPEGNPITRFEGIPFELASLGDVDVTTVAPINGDQLTWDSVAGKWVPAPAGGAGSGISGVEVQDEGTVVVATATKFNFIGAGVTASDAGGGEVDITIPGGSSSKGQLLLLPGLNDSGTNSTSLFAAQLLVIHAVCEEAREIIGLVLPSRAVPAGHQAAPVIYEGADVSAAAAITPASTTLVASGPFITPVANTYNLAPLSSPFVPVPGRIYYVGFSFKGSTNFFTMQARFTVRAWWATGTFDPPPATFPAGPSTAAGNYAGWWTY